MELEDVEGFWDWVRQEAHDRGWSIRELERRARLKRGRISNAANLGRDPTLETMQGLALALGMPLVEMQRQAGYLPPRAKLSLTDIPQLQAFLDRLARLPRESQDRIIGGALYLIELDEAARGETAEKSVLSERGQADARTD